jgi:hypothetical protein
VRVFYHDKCFDGACSAALFTRFYRERIHSDADFVFSGLLHRAGALFDEKQFDGDENPKLPGGSITTKAPFCLLPMPLTSSKIAVATSSTILRSNLAPVLSP